MGKAKFILVFDADNTLWDTNAVFHASQVAMLKPFEHAGYLKDAGKAVSELRKLDRLLMQRLDVHEYDFKLLARALALHYIDGLDYDPAVNEALAREAHEFAQPIQSLVNKSFQSYTQTLTEVPALLPDVLDTLTRLKCFKTSCPNTAMILFSEGNVDRLRRIMDAHSFKDNFHFDDVMICRKNEAAFEQARNLGLAHLKETGTSIIIPIMIGDSLKKDIAPAMKAGFTTIYIPGRFQGKEIPQSKEEQPHFQIQSISHLIEVLIQIGLPLKTEQVN